MSKKPQTANKTAKHPKDVVESPWSLAFKRLVKNKLAMFGAVILVIMILFCFIGPLFMPYGIIETNMAHRYKAPGQLGHILGTDTVGYDVFTRLMYGGRISLLVGIVVVAIQLVIGIIMGGIAGYYGGKVDSVIMRFVDIMMCLPTLPILILLGSLMSDNAVNPEDRIYIVMFIIGILSWPSLARLIRGQILSLREQEFMLATEALGLRDTSKIFRHLIPNVIPQIIVNATLGIGGAILYESTLSFLGLGVALPFPSWGNMVQAVNKPIDFATRPWLWIPPGICIFLTVLAINLLGDGLRDAFDPKMKK